jgi:lipopolysaccharide export system permease protein
MMYKKIIEFFSFGVPPTLWRYFLSQYMKVFGLSLFGFLVLLLSTRLEDFARFVSLGASFPLAALYIAYQIPYVMQIALPISSLIASLFLFQKLSQNKALTAMRASGLGLFEIITPLLVASTIIALLTFRFVLDVSATARHRAKELEFRLRSTNPLALVHNKKMLEAGGVSVEMKGSLQRDGRTTDFIMAVKNHDNSHPYLFLAKEMWVENNIVRGKNVSLISTFEGPRPAFYNHLLIENSRESFFCLDDLSRAVSDDRIRPSNDSSQLRFLFAKKKDLAEQLAMKKADGKKAKHQQNLYSSCVSEIERRASLSLAILSCAMFGAAYGMFSTRVSSRLRLFIVAGAMMFFLISYLGAKAIDRNVTLAAWLYFLPHLLFFAIATVRLRNIEHGQEV